MKDHNSHQEDDLQLLLCDEEPFFLSSPAIHSPSPAQIKCCFEEFSKPDSSALALQYHQEDQERDELFLSYIRREKTCGPCVGYLNQLRVSSNLCSARSKSVQYIINVSQRLSLGGSTALNAANYLDRFLSMNSCMNWEIWMVEILSIACLSLSCKFDEVFIPSLHDLQMGEYLEHKYRTSTIEEMEVTVLKSLNWRLSCITPLSYVAFLVDPTTQSNTGHVISLISHLLLNSLSDVKMLKFSPSIIAISSLRCVYNEIITTFNHLIPPEEMADVDKCMEIMKLHFAIMNRERREISKEWSPVSVIDARFNYK